MNINLTLIGQLIAFAIFVWFCMKFVWPPITGAMDARQKKIAEGLDAAGRAERDLKLAQEKATEMLRDTKKTALEILSLIFIITYLFFFVNGKIQKNNKKRGDTMIEEKGYPVDSGYIGLINDKYMLFETEEAYKEVLFDYELQNQRDMYAL